MENSAQSCHQTPIKAVLFDLDGTLVDTAPDLTLALNTLRIKKHLEPLSLAEVRPRVSDGAEAMIKLGFGIDSNDDDYPNLREKLLSAYQSCLLEQSELFDGVSLMLEWCQHRDIQWGIVTNKPKSLTLPLLEGLDLMRNCEVLICPEDVVNRKPAAEPILKALHRLNKKPHQALYVGDHVRDIKSAKAAETLSIAATYGYLHHPEEAKEWRADYNANTPNEVLSIIQRLSNNPKMNEPSPTP